MEDLSVHSLVSGAIDYFRANGYTESSVAERERILRKIVDMHDSVGEEHLNQAIITEPIEETESRFRRGDISGRAQRKVYQYGLARSA